MSYQRKAAIVDAELNSENANVSDPIIKESQGIHTPEEADQDPLKSQAKPYNRTKLTIGLIQTFLFFGFTIFILVSGLSVWVEQTSLSLISHPYGALLLFALLFGLAEAVLSFPLKWYSGYILEHKYNLSNQSFLQWMWENVKGWGVSIPIAVPILLALFYFLRAFGSNWWIPLGIVLFLFSVIMARLAPVLIFPLFYKFKPVDEGELREKILGLCRRVGMEVRGVFVFDMSKNTKKANAAFTGIGKSKRIILGDNLAANFTDDEIEVVFAHELGHFKMKHIWIMMLVGTISIFAGLYAAAQMYEFSLGWFGFTSIDTIAALPLLGIWLGLYSLITSPLGNILSRKFEYAADRYAIDLTKKGDSLVSSLRKLSNINLADTNPHPLVEFLFHSHPSIEKRIRQIQNL